ncbi:galectin-5-like isoform X2 [Pseudorasbora parva]|uniref:galectin-5-like isoform X2 n=1 Tax=Pseudorasbora parva TaxID=51549 RepID=UPI00351E8146
MPQYAPTPGSFKVPYKSIFHGGLEPGKVIIIQGLISPEAKRIEINLRHKIGIALHYNPRFDENMVIRNSYEDGKWGEEDRSGPFPFNRGKPLQVAIICGHQAYEVFVNGERTHTYKHRYTKLEDIDVLDIDGDLQLTFVQP